MPWILGDVNLMFWGNSIRSFLTGILVFFLVASIGIPANAVIAERPTETITPITTETPVESTPQIPISEVTSTQAETATPIVKLTAAETPGAVFTSTPTIQPAAVLSGNYVANEVLVRFKNSATEEKIDGCLKQINGEIISTIDEISVTVIRSETVNVSNAVALLSACPSVRYVEPNYLAQMTDTIPSDSDWGLQYGLINIRAPQGWDLSRGSSNVTIAVVDTGVDLGHPDLSTKIVGGYDFVNNDAIAQDDNGHGTHVAGIAAAASNNGTGVAGVSWGARIMPVKVLNAGGGGTYGDVVAGITWAADNGAHVINLSVGGTAPSLALQNAVDYAVNKGVIVVAAAGNDGVNLVRYPAVYPNTIAVGATDSSNNLAGFSNFGPEIDLVAPGVSIYSTNLGGTYGYRNGTSMATPYVAGLAAILRGIPGNSAGTVRSILEGTALDLGPAGWDAFYGNGLIQMDSAIQLALPNYTSTPPSIDNEDEIPLFHNPGGYFLTATFTPSATATFTETATMTESRTPTLTLRPVENSLSSNTPTPEIIALDTPKPTGTGAGSSWIMPICGIFLIIIGILLFLFVSRRKRRSYSGLYF
jgi:subtilisin family serine protease